MRARIAIEKYLDFRFRSFTVVTPKEIADYYRDVYVPRWRRQTPGRIIPKFLIDRINGNRTIRGASRQALGRQDWCILMSFYMRFGYQIMG